MTTQANLEILQQMRTETASLEFLARQVQDNRMPEIQQLIGTLGKKIRWALEAVD